jgi:thymidylate synthase
MEKKNNLDPQYNNLLGDILENGIKKQTRNGEVLSLFGKQIRHKMSEGFPLLTGKKMFFKGIVTELLWFLRGDTNIKFLVDNDCHIWDGDAYQAYKKEINRRLENWVDIQEGDIYDGTSLDDSGRIWTQEEFINKIKTDDKFAKKWGDLGPVYGKQWRSWYTRELMFRSDVVGEPQSLPEFFEVKVPIDQIANLINDLKTNPDSRRLMVSAWNVGDLPVTDYRTDDELYQDYLKNFE